MGRKPPAGNVVAMPQFERVGSDYYMILVPDLTGATAPRLVEMRLVEDPRTFIGDKEHELIDSIMQALGIEASRMGRREVALLVFDKRPSCLAAHADVLASFKKKRRNAGR